MRCPLCGSDFDPDDLRCHSGCPIAEVQGCNLVCCPNCGYEMVDERKSSLARLLRRWIKALPDAGSAPRGPGATGRWRP